MALMNCPECGKELSSEAKVCPHCGFPVKKATGKAGKSNKPAVIVAAVLAIIAALLLVYFLVIGPALQKGSIRLPFGLKPELTYEEALSIMSKKGFAPEKRSTAFGYQNETVFTGGTEALGQITEMTDFVWESDFKVVAHDFHEAAADFTSPDSVFSMLKNELTKLYGEPATAIAPVKYEWLNDKYQIILVARDSFFNIPYCHTVMYSYRTDADSTK